MRTRILLLNAAVAALAFASACQRSPESAPASSSLDSPRRLPTGRTLDPAGTVADVGSMPLAMILSPDGRKVLVLLNGYREQGVQVVDRASGRVDQNLPQAAAFLGIAFSPDGRTLFASGGNQDVVYRYAWRDDRATLTDSLVLAEKRGTSGTRYPGGLAPSPDGRLLYVAENLGDSLAVIDLASARDVQRLASERWPYGVAVAKDGIVYVSAWGGNTVSVFAPAKQSGAHLGRAGSSWPPSVCGAAQRGRLSPLRCVGEHRSHRRRRYEAAQVAHGDRRYAAGWTGRGEYAERVRSLGRWTAAVRRRVGQQRDCPDRSCTRDLRCRRRDWRRPHRGAVCLRNGIPRQ